MVKLQRGDTAVVATATAPPAPCRHQKRLAIRSFRGLILPKTPSAIRNRFGKITGVSCSERRAFQTKTPVGEITYLTLDTHQVRNRITTGANFCSHRRTLPQKQNALHRMWRAFTAAYRIRTSDTWIFSPLLYQAELRRRAFHLRWRSEREYIMLSRSLQARLVLYSPRSPTR